jgi:hypothetical protein
MQKSLLFAVTALILGALACQSGGTVRRGKPAEGRARSEPVSGYMVEIDASLGWQDTGLNLHNGQTVEIISLPSPFTDGDAAVADGTGTGYVCGNADCCEPLPEVPRDALIARVGREMFYVGQGDSFEAPASGNLYLRVNDCDAGLYDNHGSLRILVLP